MAVARDLFDSPDLWFAALTCPPDDDEWGEHNVTTHPIVALPLAPVWQVHDGGPRTLMTPNSAVFHHDGGEYHRERFLDRSYRCLFFFPSERLVREIVGEANDRAADADAFRFPRRTVPVDGRVLTMARRLAGRLASSGPSDGDAEPVFEVLRLIVLSAYRSRPTNHRARPSTVRARTELVEEAKALIVSRFGDRLPLDQIAHELHASPYHLARVFRAETGYSVHGYLTNIRVREGLIRRADGSGTDIAALGADLGFSSHSHFTAAFRDAMGVVPSDVEPSTFSTA
jgi:AraC family transcriptional regulator